MLMTVSGFFSGSGMNRSITFAFPAYNESENIRTMVCDAVKVGSSLADDIEVIVVDDGSRDATADEVRALQASEPRVRLLVHERNLGYGSAVFTGLTNASKELVVLTDADRQFDLSELPALLAKIDSHDLVVGYRAPRRDPLVRRLNGAAWSAVVTLLFGYTCRDVNCAFKMMHRRVIDRLKDEVESRGATFSAEFLVRAKRAGFRIGEVPVRGHRPRVAGRQTGARLDVIARAFAELIRLRIHLWREGRG